VCCPTDLEPGDYVIVSFDSFVMRRHRAVALALCLAGDAVLAQPSQPRPRRVIEIAAEDEAGEWSRKDGTGFANDIVRAAFGASAVDVRFIVVPYARCKQMVIDGAVAACFSTSRTGLDSSVVLARSPLFTCYSDYYLRANEAPRPAGATPVRAGTVVGVVRGYEYPPSVRTLVDRRVITLEEAPSEAINLQKLAEGRIGAALINHNGTKPASEIVASAGVTGKVKAGPRAGVMGSFLGFSRRHRDVGWALAAFNDGLSSITSTGELARIEARWARLALSRAGPK